MPDPPSRLAAFIAELRQRRVFRVAIVYAGVAFIIFQIVDATFDVMGIPDWLGRFLIVVLLLGFLVAVGLAWAFDLTAEGLVRTREIKRDLPKKPPRPVIGNKALRIPPWTFPLLVNSRDSKFSLCGKVPPSDTTGRCSSRTFRTVIRHLIRL